MRGKTAPVAVAAAVAARRLRHRRWAGCASHATRSPPTPVSNGTSTHRTPDASLVSKPSIAQPDARPLGASGPSPGGVAAAGWVVGLGRLGARAQPLIGVLRAAGICKAQMPRHLQSPNARCVAQSERMLASSTPTLDAGASPPPPRGLRPPGPLRVLGDGVARCAPLRRRLRGHLSHLRLCGLRLLGFRGARLAPAGSVLGAAECRHKVVVVHRARAVGVHRGGDRGDLRVAQKSMSTPQGFRRMQNAPPVL